MVPSASLDALPLNATASGATPLVGFAEATAVEDTNEIPRDWLSAVF